MIHFLNDTFNNEYKQKSSVDFCLYWSLRLCEAVRAWTRSPTEDSCLKVYGISTGAPWRTSAYIHYWQKNTLATIPLWKCMGSAGKRTSRSIEDFCLYPLLTKHTLATIPLWKCMGSAGKWTSRSTEYFCWDWLLKNNAISKQINQELHRGLLLICLMQS